MGNRVKEYMGDDSLPTNPEPERPAQPQKRRSRRRMSWQIKVSPTPLIGREGTRWLVIATTSDRVILLCPTASAEERVYAITECMKQLHEGTAVDPFKV